MLVHQTRYTEGPGRRLSGAANSCAPGGLTWLPERYRPIFGFGYPGSLVLEDDTIVTITGASLGDHGDPRRAAE